ncbi:hypothetical protein BGZ68_007636 [Mortierella alpina]|nr:hypothetical protein BGZ68_007636 [Mortierella alpina]
MPHVNRLLTSRRYAPVVNVASLVPNQRHCNLRLRVLSVETIAETIHPENQVNLLARNARLQLLNAHVNMYRGFMRLEVNEEEEENLDTNDGSRERSSITAILDNEDEDEGGPVDQRGQDERGATATTVTRATNPSGRNSSFSTAAASTSVPAVATVSLETSPAVPISASATLTPPPTGASGLSSSSSTAMSSIALSTSTLPSSSRDQMEVEMRLGTGGSVSLMEYYRTMEYTYFSTVEPVGR